MRRLTAITGLLALFSAPSQGAIAVVQKHIFDACAVTISANSATNLLAVFCESQSGTRPASVSDNATGGSNTYTEIPGARADLTGGVASLAMFYSQPAHSGATTVTCSGSCYGAAVYELSGALMSGNPVDASSGTVNVTASGFSPAGPAMTTTDAGSYIFEGIAPYNSITAVAAPYGDFLGGTSDGQASCGYLPGTTVTGSVSSWTSTASGDITAVSAVAFKPAAGGGGSVFVPRRVEISE